VKIVPFAKFHFLRNPAAKKMKIVMMVSQHSAKSKIVRHLF